MAISSISDIYNKYISSLVNKTQKTTDNTKTDGTAKDNETDTFDLTSSLSGLNDYLNYGASGNYSMSSLADYLNNENTDSDAEGLGTQNMLDNSTDSLAGLLGTDGNSDNNDSFSAAFASIADAKISEINNQIAEVLNKMSSTGNKTSDSNTDKNK